MAHGHSKRACRRGGDSEERHQLRPSVPVSQKDQLKHLPGWSGSASRKSMTACGSSVSCRTISVTSTCRRKLRSPQKSVWTKSATYVLGPDNERFGRGGRI